MRADLTVIKRSFVVDLNSRWFIIVGCCEFKYKAKGTNRKKKVSSMKPLSIAVA